MRQTVNFWPDQTVVITGGTGSLGQALTRLLLAEPVRAIRILSRDEEKQRVMESRITDPRVKWLLGDVRDCERLRRAFAGADVVIHAAALKQIPATERDPLEAVKTNVLGAWHVAEAALDAGVARVMAISSDKAAAPLNLYGASKLVAEKIILGSNVYAGSRAVGFAACRYGNVAASRGSIIPLLMQQRAAGRVTLTDSRMTRFWLTLGGAARFVLNRVADMSSGSLYVPQLPSVRITDLIEAVAPGCATDVIGIRHGEKLHEQMLTWDESRHAEDRSGYYRVHPAIQRDDLFAYDSGTNPKFLSVDQIKHELPQALREAGL